MTKKKQTDLELTCERMSVRLLELQRQMPKIAELQEENAKLKKAIEDVFKMSSIEKEYDLYDHLKKALNPKSPDTSEEQQ